MKRRSAVRQLHYKNCLSRIVIKLRGNLALPSQQLEEAIDLSLINSNLQIDKLFTSVTKKKISELVDRAKQSDSTYQPPNFFSYYAISGIDEKSPGVLLERFLRHEAVELAYAETAPTYPPSGNSTNRVGKYQGYLDPAPMGINARYAWTVKGGDGKGKVKFIDIEQGWLMDHESLTVNSVPGTGLNHHLFEDHGAGVLGIIMMKGTRTGVGITSKVKGYVVSQWRPDGSFNDADAIMTAICHLDFGDILLLESQTPDSFSSDRVWPVEIQEATYQVIRLATALGIVVIEAGGNGNSNETEGNDLDLFMINRKKILDPDDEDFRDSGAVIVAAASSNIPHTRVHYSNYGKRINCYAWGENVFTAGNHPRSSGWAINMYNEDFAGTSSASAIVAGVAIAVQNIAEMNYQFRFAPKEMREILSSDKYGTASKNGSLIDKIGVMPDLKKIIDRKLQAKKISKHIRNKSSHL